MPLIPATTDDRARQQLIRSAERVVERWDAFLVDLDPDAAKRLDLAGVDAGVEQLRRELAMQYRGGQVTIRSGTGAEPDLVYPVRPSPVEVDRMKEQWRNVAHKYTPTSADGCLLCGEGPHAWMHREGVR
jgi:hypothetical protein